MKKINYKSDFDFILKLRDCTGNDVGFPGYDWKAKFWTTMKANAVTASCTGGKCINCYNDNGQIHVVCNSHNLGAGILQMEFTAELPNEIYPDSAERVVVPVPVEIELVRAAAPCPSSIEIELMLPFIKGEKGDTGPAGEPGLQGPPGITRTPGFMPLISGVKRRRIHLGARPGIFYRNKMGLIRLCGDTGSVGSEGIEIDLNGYYVMNLNMRPLESAITDVKINVDSSGSENRCDWDFPKPGILRIVPQGGLAGNVFCVCDCLKSGNLITLRRDGKKSVFVAFSGAEPEFRLIAPRVEKIHISHVVGTHWLIGEEDSESNLDVWIWRRSSSSRKYAWRKQRCQGEPFHNVVCGAKTMFLKIRYKTKAGVSDWTYLYCRQNDNNEWVVRSAKMMI